MNTKDFTIRPEKTEDHRAVENLVRESFWNVYEFDKGFPPKEKLKLPGQIFG